tara:strand:+ start:130251 stop:133166 length:2916 start_codon:yes stop_codon:yes gene_type:complete
MLGKLPNLSELSSRIGNALSSKSNITYKYVPQPYKSVFNNEGYNSSLRKIKFDIDTFHEELIQMFADASARLNFADLYHKVNSYELKKLQAELELLLFTTSDADFYFDGSFETFSDSSNLDSELSTRDVIDLSEQCLALPYGGNNSQRIDVGSLIDFPTVGITVAEPKASEVISKKQIPGTKFGDIFADTLSAWGYEIITETNGPLEATFTFPLNPDGEVEAEFFVSRLEVIPHSDGKQNIKISTSNDNVNYAILLGYEQGSDIEDQKVTYAFDFETTLVQYVQVTLSKAEADEEILVGEVKKYRYLVGLKKFAALQTGRLSQATYISKPISFESGETIGKLSINTTQAVPAGCSVNYAVAGIIDGTQGSFIPVVPVGSQSSIGANKIITFNSINKQTTKFTTPPDGNDAPVVYGTAFQGKEFFRIGPVFDTPPVYGSSLLYRGFKAWSRDSSGSFEILNVSDNYISFEQADLESMYALETEFPSITSLPLAQDEVKRVKLQVTKPPYYDSSRGHSLKPQPGTQNSFLDTRPNYAIYKVTHKTDTERKSVTFTLGSARTQYLPVSSFLTSGTAAELPALALGTGTIYQEGVDYTYEMIDIGGRDRPTGRIIIPTGSAFLDTNGNVIATQLVFSYVAEPDITHKVSRIQGNDITLDHSSNTQYDSIEVTYRYVPSAPSLIIKSSIRISDLPSSSATRTFYVEGRDYVVDPGTGAIQRIPTGTIPTTGSVYAQFSYRGSSDTLQTFTTWGYISAGTGTQIKFDVDPTTKKNKLVVDSEVGESFFVNSKEGLINLTNATVSPVLPFGWVQFIVRSKNPSVNQSFRTNLIDQVIQLKDVNKQKIFKEYNYYFREITAYRQPLVEKTLNHLKVNTLLSDHSSFAIDATTDPFGSYIVLNFKPNETEELYLKVPTENADESNPPQDTNEDFMFTWSERTEENLVPTEVIVRVELNRNQNADGALTPKCFDFQLRVGT